MDRGLGLAKACGQPGGLACREARQCGSQLLDVTARRSQFLAWPLGGPADIVANHEGASQRHRFFYWDRADGGP
jgi:hypothetical protein